MPTVPRTQRSVAAAGLPSARRTGAPTREELGAGVGDLVAGIGVNMLEREAVKASRAADEATIQANQIAVLDAQRQLGEFANRALYDPQSGALQKRGSDAFELPEQTRASFDQEAGKIAAGLTNDDQRIAFQRIINQERDNVDGVTQRHVAGEMKRYDEEVTTATLETAQSSAIANAQDPRRIGLEIRTMVQTIRDHGTRNGVPPERVEQRIDALVSDTHTQVIDSLLASGNDRAAAVYFSEVKDAKQLQGPAIAKIERAVEEGTLRGQSQREADAIVSAGGTAAEQLEKVRKIEDPKLRDATRERVEHEQAIAKRAEAERHDAILVNAGNTIDKTGTVNAVPPAEWSSLTVGEKQALKNYAKHKAEGTEPTTDYARYYEIVKQVRDDPQAFAARNLWLDRARLNDADFKQLAAWQTSTSKTRPDPELDGFLSQTQIAKNVLVQAGIDPDPKDATGNQAQQVGKFLDRVNRGVLALQTQTGVKAKPADVQQIADNLMMQVTTERGSWAGLWGPGSFSDVSKRAFEVTIADVPQSDRAIIQRKLRERGRPADPDTIVNIYVQGLRQQQGR